MQATPTKDAYLKDLDALGADGRFAALRAAARARFVDATLPHTREEEWRQTNIAPINGTAYKSLVAPGEHGLTPEAFASASYAAEGWTELVFVDGFHAPALSTAPGLPAGVFVGSLAQVPAGPAADAVQQHLNGVLQARNAYTALNSAFLQDGAVVYVPRNTAVETPIHLLFVSSDRDAETAAHPRTLIVLEEGAQAAVIVQYVSLAQGKNHLNNAVDEIVVGKNAHLNYYKLVAEDAAGNHLATTDVRLNRDSHFASHVFTLSGAIVRNQVCTDLAGEGGSVSLTGLYLNDADRLIDNALKITHTVPNCNSRILYKGILDGKSSAVFSGHVHVLPDAQKTDSNQLSNNLLLSDGASIDTKPQLEIFADDVKCTHGATVGSPPEEIIFYFRSRGIDEATARGMLTFGFADEIVEEIDIAPIRARLRDFIFRKYSPKQ